MGTYFIGDQHFSHKNNMAYDNRPFLNTESHDEVLIGNHNNVVNVDDDVWLLGDVSWKNVTGTIEIIKQLNGRLHLVIGNHDHKFLRNKNFRDCFVEICHYKELDIGNGKQLILSHYPIPCFNGQFRGNWHFYAHVHNTEQWNMIESFKRMHEDARGAGTCNMVNVGCMMPWMGFSPKTFEEVIEGYQEYCGNNAT